MQFRLPLLRMWTERRTASAPAAAYARGSDHGPRSAPAADEGRGPDARRPDLCRKRRAYAAPSLCRNHRRHHPPAQPVLPSSAHQRSQQCHSGLEARRLRCALPGGQQHSEIRHHRRRLHRHPGPAQRALRRPRHHRRPRPIPRPRHHPDHVPQWHEPRRT